MKKKTEFQYWLLNLGYDLGLKDEFMIDESFAGNTIKIDLFDLVDRFLHDTIKKMNDLEYKRGIEDGKIIAKHGSVSYIE